MRLGSHRGVWMYIANIMMTYALLTLVLCSTFLVLMLSSTSIFLVYFPLYLHPLSHLINFPGAVNLENGIVADDSCNFCSIDEILVSNIYQVAA